MNSEWSFIVRWHNILHELKTCCFILRGTQTWKDGKWSGRYQLGMKYTNSAQLWVRYYMNIAWVENFVLYTMGHKDLKRWQMIRRHCGMKYTNSAQLWVRYHTNNEWSFIVQWHKILHELKTSCFYTMGHRDLKRWQMVRRHRDMKYTISAWLWVCYNGSFIVQLHKIFHELQINALYDEAQRWGGS